MVTIPGYKTSTTWGLSCRRGPANKNPCSPRCPRSNGQTSECVLKKWRPCRWSYPGDHELGDHADAMRLESAPQPVLTPPPKDPVPPHQTLALPTVPSDQPGPILSAGHAHGGRGVSLAPSPVLLPPGPPRGVRPLPSRHSRFQR